ncbi:MAG: TIGR01440 family protein [Christensenellales bacterium]|jgi:uncharacterized protein (TIGR01440 family)
MEENFAAEMRLLAENLEALAAVAPIEPGDVLALGCSTSELTGGQIGRHSSRRAGQAVIATALAFCQRRRLSLAVQCCEHLNRALVVERAVAKARGWTRVSAVPQLHAGGAAALAAWEAFEEPVLVAQIQAELGMDVGGTLMGMHLRPVAVPVRAPYRQVGGAIVTLAYTRPPLIGGERARYAHIPDADSPRR